MSIELGLQHLSIAGSGDCAPSGTLEHVLWVVRRVYAEEGIADEATVANDGQSLRINLPDGTASIETNCALFQLYPLGDIDRVSVRMIFEIARAANMVILGDGLTVITNPAQPLPSWLSDAKPVRLCSSNEELGQLLNEWRKEFGQTPESQRSSDLIRVPALNSRGSRVFLEVQELGEHAPDLGSIPESPASFVYVEATHTETATKQMDSIHKHYRATCQATVHRPSDGMLVAELRRLETPKGQVFYAYRYGGDKENWLNLILDFAAASRRAVGRIQNFDTFVLDDGCGFPLSACRCTKVNE